MPNWCTCNLVVTGPLAETTRLRQRLSALSLFALDNPLIAAASPKDAPPLKTQPDPVTFHTLLPPPPDLREQDLVNWQQGAWGTKWEPGEDAREMGEPGRLVYQFSTAWGPPDRWVRMLAEAYPALGIALHSTEPGVGLCVTEIYQAGTLAQELDYAAAGNRAEWLDSIFGYSDDDEEPKEDLPNVSIVEEAEPVPGIQESDFLLLSEARDAEAVARVEVRWQERNVPEHVRLTLLADHAPHFSNDMLSRILASPGAARRLILRERWPSAVAPAIARWASELLRAPMPRRPSLPIDNSLEALGEHGAAIASMIQESLAKHRMVPGLAEYQQAGDRLDLARQGLERVAGERAASWGEPWVQELAVLLNAPEKNVRTAAGSFFAHLRDTPAGVLKRIEANLPTDRTKLGDLLLLHPQAPMRLRRRRIAQATTGGLLRLLARPRLRRTPSLRRAILDMEDVHPGVLCDLAGDAEPEEFGRIIERVVFRPRFALMALERAGASQREAVSPAVWARLLETPDRELRQRALLVVRQPATRSPHSRG